MPGLQNIEIPVYKKIAVALDFSENDIKLLASCYWAGQQGYSVCPDTCSRKCHQPYYWVKKQTIMKQKKTKRDLIFL